MGCPGPGLFEFSLLKSQNYFEVLLGFAYDIRETQSLFVFEFCNT